MGAMPFEAAVENLAGGACAVTVTGELDLQSTASVERLIEALAEEPPPGLLIDLTECEFIDSTGIALIVNTWKQLDGGSGASSRVVICAPGTQVRRVIDITGLAREIPVFSGRSEAERELAVVRPGRP